TCSRTFRRGRNRGVRLWVWSSFHLLSDEVVAAERRHEMRRRGLVTEQPLGSELFGFGGQQVELNGFASYPSGVFGVGVGLVLQGERVGLASFSGSFGVGHGVGGR